MNCSNCTDKLRLGIAEIYENPDKRKKLEERKNKLQLYMKKLEKKKSNQDYELKTMTI